MGITDELDPSIVDFEDETALMEFDVNVPAAAQNEREGRHHRTVEDERARRLHFLVKDHVGRVVRDGRVQHRRRVNAHLNVQFININNSHNNMNNPFLKRLRIKVITASLVSVKNFN